MSQKMQKTVEVPEIEERRVLMTQRVQKTVKTSEHEWDSIPVIQKV